LKRHNDSFLFNPPLPIGFGGHQLNKNQSSFSNIISLENLFLSWQEFRYGKRHKKDVQDFEKKLENNIFSLHQELILGKYQHSNYTSFHITDPKQRHIHKATVRDRIVHHAVYRILYPIFDKTFIYDSYSCRNSKGTHCAVNRLKRFARKLSQNYTEPCFVLKCDIKKYFGSVDHQILFNLIKKKIKDEKCLSLIREIIDSYRSKPMFQSAENYHLLNFSLRSKNNSLGFFRERERLEAVYLELVERLEK